MISLHQHVSLVPLIANELDDLLKGFSFAQAWSKDKQELSLIFKKGEEVLSLQFNTEARCGLFFFYEYPLERPGGVVPLFQNLENSIIQQVSYHPNNRSFQIDFGNNSLLVFKLYGPLSNVLLFENQQVSKLFRHGIENDWNQKLSDLQGQIESDKYPFQGVFYIGSNQENPREPLLTFAPSSEVWVQTEHLPEALNEFSARYLQYFSFENARQNLFSHYKQKVKREQGQVIGAQKFLDHVNSSVPPDEVGHILMANLHAIKKGETMVTLFDFYRNQNIEISLKKDLSPQDNAANYYQKAKNRKKEIALKEELLTKAKGRLEQYKEVFGKIQLATQMKEIKPWLKEEKQKQEIPLREKFRHFECLGYHIFVGKNAVNNDLLTLKFAHKEDVWLHAKGVSGSHVVIKHHPHQVIPLPVIQYAAAIAAHYSSAAGASYVPVIYTPKKYVRKPKGAHAGQVAVEREEIIMAEPSLTFK